MTNFEELIDTARQQRASDLHLESGLPAAFRMSGFLHTSGESISSKSLLDMAHELIGAKD